MDLRKLHRSEDERMIAGVCGGLGRYIGVDVTVVRLLWALWGATGMGIVAYLIAACIIPREFD